MLLYKSLHMKKMFKGKIGTDTIFQTGYKMEKWCLSLFCVVLTILITLQDVSYALSPPSRFRPIAVGDNSGPPASLAVESDGDALRQPDANAFTSQYMFEILKRYKAHLYAKELVEGELEELGGMLKILEEYLAKSSKTAGPPEIFKVIDGKIRWFVSEEKIKGILNRKKYRKTTIDLLIQLAQLHILYPAEKERLPAQIVAILAYLSIIYFDNLANPDNPAVILFITQHLGMTRQDLIAIGPSAVPVLRHILNTADPEHMGRAATLALGLIDSPEAISVLVAALETAPEKVRKWAIIALGLPESLSVNVVSSLIDILETTIDDELRYALAITLCSLTFKHPEIKEKIERWMHNFVFNSDDSPWAPKGIRYAEFPELWFEGSKDILRQKMPTLIKILENPYCLARFLFVLSVFRTKFKYFIANDIQIPPIAYARQAGIRFKLGELHIVPISESYRRHIIYAEDGDGRIFAIEIKIPGQHEDRNVIQEANFSVARELWKKYPSEPGVVKPLFFIRLNGQFPLYGRDIDFSKEEPLGIAGFEYEDGKRFRNIRDEFFAEIVRKTGMPFEEIMRSVVINILAAAIRIHHLGYRGSSDAGTDMHNENLRILDDGRVVFVGDFGAFEYTGEVPLDVRREETAGLLGMFGPVVDWLLLGVIEKVTKAEPIKEVRAQMALEAILELNRQKELQSLMEILEKIQKGKEALSFVDHSLSDIEREILTMVKKQKKASVFSYFLSLFKEEKGGGSVFSPAGEAAREKNRTVPISLSENLKSILKRYNDPDAKAPPDFSEGQNFIRQILFAAEELPEAEEIKREVAHVLAKWLLKLLETLVTQIEKMRKDDDFKGIIKTIDEFLKNPLITKIWNEEHRLPLFRKFEIPAGNHFLAYIRGGPLGVVYGYAQLIHGVQPADKKYSEYKEKIREAIKDTESSLGQFRDKLAESLYEKKGEKGDSPDFHNRTIIAKDISSGAEDNRDLKPFFKKHELGFKNIAAVTMAAKALKYLIIDKNEKERAIRKKIEELNESFHNSEIEIEIERQIKTGIFKCSGKEYKYAVFHFKEEKKTINVSFLEDRAALTSAELAELRIQDTEKHHLDCPGLEGVWFINSVLSQNSQNRDSDHFSDRTPDRKMVAVPILQAARIHVENLKYAPTIPEKTMLCHIIADSILPIGQRNMLKMLEQDMRGKEYGEKVVSLSGVSHDNSEEFIAALSRVKAGAEKIYREQGIERVEFVAACPNTALVSKVQSVLGIKAIAFKPCKEGEVDIIQVEGITLALRALHSGKIEALKAAFKIINGEDLPPDLLKITDINELARRIIFILPAAKAVDYGEIRELNDIIRKNIEAAA